MNAMYVPTGHYGFAGRLPSHDRVPPGGTCCTRSCAGVSMALAETEELTRMICGAALSRAICAIGELGVADHITSGAPQPVETLARLTKTHERFLYRLLRFTASHGLFSESMIENSTTRHCRQRCAATRPERSDPPRKCFIASLQGGTGSIIPSGRESPAL